MRIQRSIAILMSALTLGIVPADAHALEVEKLATALAELRGDIEDLSASIDDQKRRGRTTVQALELRKAELEATHRRLETRVNALSAKKAGLDEKQASHQKKRTALNAATQSALKRVRAYVAQGLPFRVTERLAELDELEAQLAQKKIAPIRALGMLWERVEDELRLTRESGLDRQVVTVDGQEFLTPVIRVGMLMLFYLTDEGVAGRAVKQDGQWSWQPYEGDGQTQQVASLFDSFKKRIRVGLFDVPNAVAAGGQK